MAALTTLNITEKNANNSLSVTVKVNVTKEGVFTTTLSKEDVDKIHSYGIKLPTNRLGNEGYFNSIALSDLESQIREVLKRCLSYKIVEEVPVIKYQLETNCTFSYDKNGNIVPNPSKEWTGGDENGEWRDGTSRLDALNAQPFGFSVYAKPFLKRVIEYGNGVTKIWKNTTKNSKNPDLQKKHCEGLRKHIANLERRLLKHILANVILSIISVATIIALFTLIQN